MIEYVIDASVAAKWLFVETDSDFATRILERLGIGELVAHVPDLFYAEIASVLAKKLRVRDLQTAEIREAGKQLARVEMMVHPNRDLFERALELSLQTGRSLYDCHYLALAERLEIQLITADRRLYNGMASSKWERYSMWIGDIR